MLATHPLFRLYPWTRAALFRVQQYRPMTICRRGALMTTTTHGRSPCGRYGRSGTALAVAAVGLFAVAGATTRTCRRWRGGDRRDRIAAAFVPGSTMTSQDHTRRKDDRDSPRLTPAIFNNATTNCEDYNALKIRVKLVISRLNSENFDFYKNQFRNVPLNFSMTRNYSHQPLNGHMP
jgi:hypothetical protein